MTGVAGRRRDRIVTSAFIAVLFGAGALVNGCALLAHVWG
jgi:hypothetical protein